MADINTLLAANGNPGLDQFVGGLVIYIYLSYTVMVLATSLGTARPWLAWIPIANFYLMTKMAALEWWWMLGLFIPIVNFFVGAYIWSEIGKRLGKPWWIGALFVVPFFGLLVPGYLVVVTGRFAKSKVVHPEHQEPKNQ